MANYSIGDVETLTGVKAHILRYWETVIPGLAPQKNVAGWRMYSQREIDIILRLKYLINEKKFTIEGARNQIIEEAEIANETDAGETLQTIHDLRSDLTTMYVSIHKYKSSENENVETKIEKSNE